MIKKISTKNGMYPIAKDVGRVLAKTILNSTHRGLIDAIFDKTIGWYDPDNPVKENYKKRKLTENIKFKFFIEYTGLKKSNISAALSQLVDWNIIKREKKGRFYLYTFNKYVSEWNRAVFRKIFQEEKWGKVIHIDNHSKVLNDKDSQMVMDIDNHSKVIHIDNQKVMDIDNHRLSKWITKSDQKDNNDNNLDDSKKLLLNNYKKITKKEKKSTSTKKKFEVEWRIFNSFRELIVNHYEKEFEKHRPAITKKLEAGYSEKDIIQSFHNKRKIMDSEDYWDGWRKKQNLKDFLNWGSGFDKFRPDEFNPKEFIDYKQKGGVKYGKKSDKGFSPISKKILNSKKPVNI